MRRSLLSLAAIALCLLVLLPLVRGARPVGTPVGTAEHEPSREPNDWFWMQRAYPGVTLSQDALARGMAQAAAKEAGGALMNRSTWTQAGPTNVGGRVTDIAVHPTNPDLAYAAMASGGQSLLNAGSDGPVGMQRFGTAAQNGRIAGFQA